MASVCNYLFLISFGDSRRLRFKMCDFVDIFMLMFVIKCEPSANMI